MPPPAARPRPALFRALGHDEPAPTVEVGGQTYRLVRVLKHDSWAATACYAGESGMLAVKFNRVQSVGPLPATWLGRWLARRESRMMRTLADVPDVCRCAGEVVVDGKPIPNAVAHHWVAGHPLAPKEKVGDDFFPALERLLAEVHARGIAYVDLHKRENVLVTDDGRPCLIDFQISQAWPTGNFLTRYLLRLLQRSDSYHLRKHVIRHRPDQAGGPGTQRIRPWWIRLHRLVAQPLRSLRRRLLVRLSVRTDGTAASETFVEEGLRAHPR